VVGIRGCQTGGEPTGGNLTFRIWVVALVSTSLRIFPILPKNPFAPLSGGGLLCCGATKRPATGLGTPSLHGSGPPSGAVTVEVVVRQRHCVLRRGAAGPGRGGRGVELPKGGGV